MSAIATHYDVLGVDRDASAQAIRTAYRSLARQLHPDTSAHDSDEMARVNEAYRVLADPGRRAVYDRTLLTHAHTPGDVAGTAHASPDSEAPVDPDRPTFLSPAGPARVPWKLMAVLAALGTTAVLASSALDGSEDKGPDGIIRPGSCVALEPNGDAREVACTGEPDDLVVDVLVPLDATCPAGTMAHRDRQGLGIACVVA